MDRQGDALDYGDRDREMQLRSKDRGQTRGARETPLRSKDRGQTRGDRETPLRSKERGQTRGDRETPLRSKERGQTRGDRRGGRALRGSPAHRHFQPPDCGRRDFCGLNHPVCDTLLWSPQGTPGSEGLF